MSDNRTLALFSPSKYWLPFIRIPFSLARPRPDIKLSGTDNTRAHGHDITKNVAAKNIESYQSTPKNRGGMIATISAIATTIGV